MADIGKIIKNMTLQQKAMQLTQVDATYICDDDNATVTGNREKIVGESDVKLVGSALNFSGDAMAKKVQSEHLKTSEIPLLLMQDVIHGYRTIYPINLAMGGSFDVDLNEKCAEMAGKEARENGVHVAFAPMVDLVRDARWGRVMETTGEDPFLNGVMGIAAIRGFKRGGVAVCVKHFAAYGAAESGREYNTTDISEHTLKEYYLRAYEECLKEDPEMVMTSFNALNGIPVNGHKELLVDLLRKKWNFDGVVISDYNAVREMIVHGYLPTEKDCALVAAENEIDIEMMSPCYAHHLAELVHEGKITEREIDIMVAHVLKLKEKLGLFDDPYRGINDGAFTAPLKKEHRELARIAAEKTCVLLKNDGVLPLKEQEKVSLIGPFSDSGEIIGNWSCYGKAEETVTVKQGIENLLLRKIKTAKGCSGDLLSTDESGFKEAIKVAKKSDTIILCLGENALDSGEAGSRAKIELPQVQINLLKALKRLNKKIVLVIFAGRPIALTEAVKYADAVLYAWQPGTEGGNAIANLLYGIVSPSAKITMSFPRSTGQCPIYYNHFNTGRPKPEDKFIERACVSYYKDELNSPLYPFGFGLTYTRFELGEIALSKDVLSHGEKLTAEITVKNVGERFGEETLQLYICDRFASCVRPVKELKAFKKVGLNAGESTEVKFIIDEEMLKFHTASGEFAAEDGDFDLFIGLNSEDVKSASFVLVG